MSFEQAPDVLARVQFKLSSRDMRDIGQQIDPDIDVTKYSTLSPNDSFDPSSELIAC